MPVSALKRTNLDKLLEAIHLQAEILDLKANPNRSAEGIVMEGRQATPFYGTALVPGRPYRYVLEVNQGWFERHGLGAGAAVTLPANVPTATE